MDHGKSFEANIKKLILDSEKFAPGIGFDEEANQSTLTSHRLDGLPNSVYRHPIVRSLLDSPTGTINRDKLLMMTKANHRRQRQSKSSVNSFSLEDSRDQESITESRKEIRSRLRYDFKDLQKLQSKFIESTESYQVRSQLRKKLEEVRAPLKRVQEHLEKLENSVYKTVKGSEEFDLDWGAPVQKEKKKPNLLLRNRAVKSMGQAQDEVITTKPLKV